MNKLITIFLLLFTVTVLQSQTNGVWEKLGNAQGGYAPTLSVKNNGAVYATMIYDSKMFQSTDEGKNWEEFDAQKHPGILIIGKDGTITFQERILNSDQSFNRLEVFYSKDNGVTYSKKTITNDIIQILPLSNGSWAGISHIYDFNTTWHTTTTFLSTDEGDTWAPTSEVPHTQLRLHNPKISEPTNGFLLILDGIGQSIGFTSSDFSATWKRLAPGFGVLTNDDLRFTRDANGNLWALGTGNCSKSEDNGASWTVIEPDSIFINYGFHFAVLSNGNLLAQKRNGGNDLITWRTYLSEDQGNTWQSIILPLDIRLHHEPLPSGEILGERYGILRSENGNDWSHSDNGMVEAVPSGLRWISEDTVFAKAGYRFVRSYDRGQNWEIIGEDSTSYYISSTSVSEIVDDKQLFSSDDRVFLTGDKGNSFKNITPANLPRVASGGAHSVSISPDGIFFAGFRLGTYRSEDQGENWQITADSLMLRNFKYHPDGRWFAFGYHAASSALQGFYFSDDKGFTWSAVSNKYLYDLAIDDFGRIVSTNSDFLQISDDTGDSFDRIGNQIPGTSRGFFRFDPSGNLIFTASDRLQPHRTRLYMTQDKGKSFFQFPLPDDILEPVGLNVQAHDPYLSPENYLYISDLQGLYRFSIPTTEFDRLAGSVNRDDENDCFTDGTEEPMPGWVVQIKNGQSEFFAHTDETGSFESLVLPKDYDVEVLEPNLYWANCPSVEVTVENLFPAAANQMGSLPAAPTVQCPLMKVKLNTPFLRRCFDNSYWVNYQNEGTESAQDVVLTVELDEYFDYIDASVAPQQIDGKVLTFEVGNLKPGESGEIKINFNLSCDAPIYALHSTKANIIPDELCGPYDWQGGILSAETTCTDDSEAEFILRNIGDLPFSKELNYRIYSNGCNNVIWEGTLSLGPGDTLLLNVHDLIPDLAEDYTYFYLIAEQETDYPFGDKVRACVHNCNSNPDILRYPEPFAILPTDDPIPQYDLDQRVNIGSWDPNDIQVTPVGYEAEHLIENDTELEYLIRFQNTGTDTAFNVLVKNLISTDLDMSRLRFGASSHPYTYEFRNGDEIWFSFENIMLPDSNINEVASHGFLSYSVELKPDIPLGKKVKGKAAIFFDFNEPVLTNQVFNTIGENFLPGGTSSTSDVQTQQEFSLFPNPASSEIFIQTPKEFKGDLNFSLYNQLGQTVLVKDLSISNEKIKVPLPKLIFGNYFYKIESKNKTVARGKLVLIE